jgi:hypothetical protein
MAGEQAHYVQDLNTSEKWKFLTGHPLLPKPAAIADSMALAHHAGRTKKGYASA